MDVLDINHLLKTTPFIIFLNGTIFFRQPFATASYRVPGTLPDPPVPAISALKKRGTTTGNHCNHDGLMRVKKWTAIAPFTSVATFTISVRYKGNNNICIHRDGRALSIPANIRVVRRTSEN